jgi:hypothetical protein
MRLVTTLLALAPAIALWGTPATAQGQGQAAACFF